MRAVRAGMFASSSVALAAGAHRLAGGAQPNGTVLLAAAAGLFAFGAVWARRERGGRAIATVVLLSQLGLHAAFVLAPVRAGGHDGATPELNRWAAMLLCNNAGHQATVAQVNTARAALGLGPLPTSPPAMHMAGTFTAGGASMLGLHLGAALVMAWWLRRGERAAWAVAQRIVAAGRPVATVIPSCATSRAAGVVWVPRHWTFGAGLAGRGPPTGFGPVRAA